MGFQFVHFTIEQVDTLVECTEKAVLFFLDDACNQFALNRQLRVGDAHFLNQNVDEPVQECFLLPEEGVAIAHGAAQDTADDVAGFGVAWQLSIGNRESHGTQMVSHNAHGDVDFLLFGRAFSLFTAGCGEPIRVARQPLYFLDDGLEDIGVVVGMFLLEDADQALEAQTGVDDVHAELLQRTIAAPVVLHEDEIPDFNDLWVVLVDQLAAWNQGLLLVGTVVDVNLGAGATGASVAHLPEVVVLVAVDDVVLGGVL